MVAFHSATGRDGGRLFRLFHARGLIRRGMELAGLGKGDAFRNGTVGGPAAGALIGGIASNDPGKGAAWGAVLGGIGNRRRARREAERRQQIEQQKLLTQGAIARRIESFKKAFAVYLEAKRHMMKFYPVALVTGPEVSKRLGFVNG